MTSGTALILAATGVFVYGQFRQGLDGRTAAELEERAAALGQGHLVLDRPARARRHILGVSLDYMIQQSYTGPMEHPLPDALVDLIAERFRVIGEPMRIKLLDQMRNGSATVQELTEATGATQTNASKHLAVLHQAGVVSREKDGIYVHYAIADASVFDLCEQVCGGLKRRLNVLDSTLSSQAA